MTEHKKDLPPIHEHPAFRALVEALAEQSDEQHERFMEYLEKELEKEKANGKEELE